MKRSTVELVTCREFRWVELMTRHLNGFAVQDAQKGVALVDADDSRVYRLRVKNPAQGDI